MSFSAAVTLCPPMRTVPSSGYEIRPASVTRVSSVSSGFWKTLMRTTSPLPSRYSLGAPACGCAWAWA